MAGDWPLVGRDHEIGTVDRWIRSREQRGVVLAGSAGIGKTRLGSECLAQAERAGLPTISVAATRSAAAIPFGALAPLLPPQQHEVAEQIQDKADLMRRCCTALTERADGKRLVILVDDAHLLDDASATLVYHLVSTEAVFAIITLRVGESVPDPIVNLWKNGLAERLDIGSLPTGALDELLASVLEGPIEPSAVSRLALRSEGNILYLRELVIGALESGCLTKDSGFWRLTGSLTPSDRLVELVETRLAGLTDEERSLLEFVSLGEPMGPAELGAVSDPQVAEALERRSLLTSRLNGRRLEIRLAHPLYGEVLRSRLSRLRLRKISRLLAQAVEATGVRRREDELRIATWHLESGSAVRADLMLSAASVARQRHDFELAERLGEAAISAGAGFDGRFFVAQTLSLRDQTEEAELRLSALAADASDDHRRGLVAVTRMDNLQYGLGLSSAALEVGEATEETIKDPVWRYEIAARRAAILVRTEGPKAAVEAAEPVCQHARGRAQVWAYLFSTVGLSRMGRLQKVMEYTDAGYGSAQALTGPPLYWPPEIFASMRCEALIHAGRFEEAEELATTEYYRAVAEDSDEMRGVYAWFLAKVLAARGRVATATRHGFEAAGIFRQLCRQPFLAHALGILATTLAISSRGDEAATTLAELDDLNMPPKAVYAVEALQAKAWTAICKGDLRKGHGIFDEAIALAESTGDLAGQLSAMHDLARVGFARAVVDRLGDIGSVMEGDLPQARCDHIQYLATHQARGLEEVSRVFENLGTDLLAAEASADAAVAWRRNGDARRAANAERRVAMLASRCEGVVTPALSATSPRAVITPAEKEVALLAAAGRSNREISEELVLSLRTVENYLHRIYAKLGISGRGELSDELGLSSSRGVDASTRI